MHGYGLRYGHQVAPAAHGEAPRALGRPHALALAHHGLVRSHAACR